MSIYVWTVNSWREWIELSKKGYTEVQWNFYFWREGKIDSLEGSPRKVSGDFDMHSCGIKSLRGMPLLIKHNCILSNNNLVDTIWIESTQIWGNLILNKNKLEKISKFPKTLMGSLDIRENRLTEIKRFPSKLEWLDCAGNQIESFDWSLKEVSTRLDCSFNKIKSMVGFPPKIWVLDVSNNLLIDLKWIPKHIEISLHIEDNKKAFSEEEIKKITNLDSSEIYV